MIRGFLLFAVGGFLLGVFSIWWQNRNGGASCPDKYESAHIVNITSCARRDYDIDKASCSREPALEYFGDDVRTYRDDWEWDRLYTVNWKDVDPNYPLHFQWNITDVTVTFKELPVRQSALTFSFPELAEAHTAERSEKYAAERTEEYEAEGEVEYRTEQRQTDEAKYLQCIKEKALQSKHDNRIHIMQKDKTFGSFIGPRFRIVDEKADLIVSLDDNAMVAENEEIRFDSKFAAQVFVEGPEGIAKLAFTGTLDRRRGPAPTSTGVVAS